MSIRLKLMIWAIATVVLANLALSLAGVSFLRSDWNREVQTRVGLDLNSAEAAYQSHLLGIHGYLQAASLNGDLSSALEWGDQATLQDALGRLYAQGKMDFLNALDEHGRVVFRARQPAVAGDQPDNALVARAVAGKQALQGTIVLDGTQLRHEGPELAEEASIVVVPTPAAKPSSVEQSTSGMVAAAVVPVGGEDGRVVGFLYGGDLLNRRNEIVDRIRDEVFQSQAHEGRDLGTVTLFLGDLRVSTNVTRRDGTRAVGTRLSSTVHDAVLLEGKTWNDRAFVVNDWYISAYEPIRDPAGAIIGALYVGLLEEPFVKRHMTVTVTMVVAMAAATAITLVLLLWVMSLVLKPIPRVVRMAREIVAGNLEARLGIRPPGEMGVLCEAIDRMADAVADRERRLTVATRQQLGRSEKLASIGRLAAGIAHEINNPLTGVLTFSHLLREKPKMDDEDRQDLDLIIHETTRAADVVRGLLDFARERPVLMESLDLNHVVRQTVRLIRNQKVFERITIAEELAESLPDVEGDRNQLQQVLLNLALNACAAMPEGGRMTISTRTSEGEIHMALADTGCGIPPEDMDKIFDPFFTTKPVGEGTGLGLSVSHGIVDRHGGRIEAESRVGQGTTFTIVLPVKDTTSESGSGFSLSEDADPALSPSPEKPLSEGQDS